MRAIAMASLMVAVTACGGDEPPKPAKKPGTTAPVAPQGRPAGSTGSVAQLVLRPKVDNRFRKEFTKTDFDPDATGEINRDPFLSYLVTPTPAPGAGASAQNQKDECENRTVAGNYAYTDLHLVGIVVRGTKSFAMFKDPAQVGQIVYTKDCLSKDKARITEITPSCVRLDIRGEAPPGAPAPPAHEEKNCLHAEDIEIE